MPNFLFFINMSLLKVGSHAQGFNDLHSIKKTFGNETLTKCTEGNGKQITVERVSIDDNQMQEIQLVTEFTSICWEAANGSY